MRLIIVFLKMFMQYLKVVCSTAEFLSWNSLSNNLRSKHLWIQRWRWVGEGWMRGKRRAACEQEVRCLRKGVDIR